MNKKNYLSLPKFFIENPNENKLDHSITIVMIVFVIILFSSIQFFARPLNGNYTIDASGSGINNFITIAAAVSALYSNGIDGPVTFEIIGTFDEQIDLNGAITGSSKFNPVTFEAANPGSGLILYTVPSPTNNFIVNINNAKYVNFRNIAFSLNYQPGEEGNIIFSETPDGSITFEGNTFTGITSSNNTGSNNSLVYINANSSSENIDDFVFIDNIFVYGSYGIYLETNTSNPSSNISIVDNNFDTDHSAMYLSNLDAPEISSNTITNNSNNYAISLNNCSNDYLISKNIITTTTVDGSGIELNSCSSAGSNGLVVNNFIQATYNGIYITSSSDINIYFNSINIKDISSSTSLQSTAIDITPTCNNLELLNNIFANERNGLAFDGGAQISNSDYNCFFSNGTVLAKWNNASCNTLAELIISNGYLFDLNSKETDPNFTSTIDLHTNEPQLHKAGTQIALVTTDIDNDLRVSATPCIGADEYYLPLSGTYTIGNDADYSTISDAVYDLYESGIDGAVIFKLKDGQFNEQINLDGAIMGSSGNNTVTFESNSGFHGNVNVSYTAGSSSSNYVLRINEARYLKFRNLTFTAGGENFARVVVLENVIGDMEFYNNVMNGFEITSGNGTSEQDIIYTNDGSRLLNTTFDKNDINHGRHGIYLKLNVSLKSPNLIINDNNISTLRTSIHVQGANAPIVALNNIYSASSYAIEMRYCENNMLIEKNNITNGVILIYQFNPNSNQYGFIKNNFILLGTNSYVNALYLEVVKYLKIYNNTILLKSSLDQNRSTIKISTSSNTNINIVNNIIINEDEGFAIDWEGGSIELCDYNNVYSNGPKLVKHGNAEYATLSVWQSAPGSFDLNSYSVPVTFASEMDLHFINASEILYGTALLEVPDDIDGDSRNDPPFIGADEPILDISELTLNIFLEGPFNTVSQKMNANLTIPNTSPYSEHYKNVENIPNGTVDWVLVKLLDDQFNTVVAQSALLISDGTIISADGSSTLKFLVDIESDYYVVVEHRNHLSVMSNSTDQFWKN
jgi:hypothetical protein